MSLTRLIMMFTLAGLTMATAWAKDVTLDRILAEHRITVVTTEKPDSISRFLFDMQVRTDNYLTVTELVTRKSKLGKGQSLLFIIDRKKARRLIDEEESVLPCRTSVIDPNEVVMYAVKSAGRNAWEILISAPNEKWLRWELERLCKSGLSGYRLHERGTVLDRFRVKRLCVVSTEGRQLAADWVARQTSPGSDTIDWEFYPADLWEGSIDGGTDILFMLNRNAITDKMKPIKSYLPKSFQAWFAGEASAEEHAVEKQVVSDELGQPRNVFTVAAPCSRHVQLALEKYPRLESIPESLERKRLADLRGYGRVVVVARSGEDEGNGGSKVIDDLAGRLTNEITARTGFECICRQDLKELAFETYVNYIPNREVDEIRRKTGDAMAVAVIDVTALAAETNYIAKSPRRITPTLPPFNEEKPSRPREPRPSDKPLFGAHRYDEINGSRANDPDYIRDHNNWRHVLMPRYRDELDQWERRARAYEHRRHARDMEWLLSVDRVQSASFSGHLRIYDLSSADIDKMGRVIFSCPVAGNAERRTVHKEDRVVVTGEDSHPRSPVVPPAVQGVSDQSVVSESFKSACDAAVNELLRGAMLPIDR